MDKEKRQIECKSAGCKLTGVWSETGADGKTLVCFRTRHRGENHAQKFTFAEYVQITGIPLSEIAVFLSHKQRNE